MTGAPRAEMKRLHDQIVDLNARHRRTRRHKEYRTESVKRPFEQLLDIALAVGPGDATKEEFEKFVMQRVDEASIPDCLYGLALIRSLLRENRTVGLVANIPDMENWETFSSTFEHLVY